MDMTRIWNAGVIAIEAVGVGVCVLAPLLLGGWIEWRFL